MDSAKLPITGPCPIDLDAIGFDRSSKKAHCTHCVKSVHNLSNMTEPEARAFLKRNAGERICVSYARGKDGSIRFADRAPAPVVPLSRLRRAKPATLPAAAGIGLAAALAACTPVDNPDVSRPPSVQTEKTVEPRHEIVAGDVMPERLPPEDMVEGGMKVPEVDVVDAGEMVVEDVVDGEIEAIDPEMIEGEIQAVDPSAETPDEPCDKASKGKGKASPDGPARARAMDPL